MIFLLILIIFLQIIVLYFNYMALLKLENKEVPKFTMPKIFKKESHADVFVQQEKTEEEIAIERENSLEVKPLPK